VVGDFHRLQRGVASPGSAARCGRRSHRRGRAQVVNRCIDDVAIDVELALNDVAKVEGGGEAGRQLNALLGHVAGEYGAIGDVAEVGVGTDVTDPRREIRGGVHCQRERVALTNRDIDQLQIPLFSKVRQLARRIERGADDRDWMGQQLHSALPRCRGSCGLRLRCP
jgi:hypothetical protein